MSDAGAGAILFQMVDHLGQRLPVDQRHGVIVDAPIAADGVDGDNVRVIQGCGGFGFVLKTHDGVLIQQGSEPKYLEGDGTA